MVNFGTTAITPENFVGRIEDRVKSTSGLPPERAFLTLTTDDEHISKPPASKFVTIFPARFPPWQGVYSGAGETGFDVAIRTTVFCRLTSDQELRASRILRDPNDGVLSLMFAVVRGLQGWTMPLDDDENKSHLREPMRVVGSGPELVTKKQSANVWVLAWIMWEAKATFILNPQATSSPS